MPETHQPDETFEQLHRRIKKGDLAGLRRQLDEGLDPNIRNRFGWTLLMLAALEGRIDVLELLITRGADPRLENQFGQTAVALANDKGHQRAADLLSRYLPQKSGE